MHPHPTPLSDLAVAAASEQDAGDYCCRGYRERRREEMRPGVVLVHLSTSVRPGCGLAR